MKNVVLRLFFGFLIAALLSPGISTASEKTPIRVFISYDLTGAYSGLQKESDLGVRMYMKHWNDKELIPGVEILYDIYDSGNNAEKIRAAMLDCFGKSPKPVLALDGISSALGVVVKPLGERNKIPILAASSARGILFPPSWSFSTQPDYPSLLGAAGKWIKDNWKADSKIPWIKANYKNRNPRLALVAWDNAFGRSFRTKETDEYFKEIGVDFVGEEYIPYAPKDTTPNLRRLKSEGVDFIYVVAYDAAHAILLKDAQRLGMRQSFMDFAFWYTDPVMIRKHTGPDLLKNTLILTGYQPILDEQPEFVKKWYKEELKRGENDPLLACTAMIQWLDMWREVIQRTVDRVGVKNVTGEACYETITTNFKGYKPICGTVTQTYSKTRTFGPSAGSVFMFEGNTMKKVDSDVPIPNLAPVEYREKL